MFPSNHPFIWHDYYSGEMQVNMLDDVDHLLGQEDIHLNTVSLIVWVNGDTSLALESPEVLDKYMHWKAGLPPHSLELDLDLPWEP